MVLQELESLKVTAQGMRLEEFSDSGKPSYFSLICIRSFFSSEPAY